jgi:hypothetical protein
MDKTTKKLITYTNQLNILILIFALCYAIIFAMPVEAFNYVTYTPSTNTGNCNTYNIPSESFPSKMGSYTDQNFNTTVRRFTDYVADYGGGPRPNIQYTTFTCGNSDNSMVAFGYSSTSKLFYKSDGDFIRLESFGSTTGDIEFRWSMTDPNIGYYRRNAQFYQYNVTTDTHTLLHDFTDEFPTAANASNEDKGEQSWNDRYWVFRISISGVDSGYNVSYVVTYDLQTDTVIGQLDVQAFMQSQFGSSSKYVRWATVSPSGNYVILMGDNSPHLGTSVFDINLNYINQVQANQIGHPAWGYDINGNEVVYWANAPNFKMHVLGGPNQNVTYLFNIPNNCGQCTTSQFNESVQGGAGYHFATSRGAPGWLFVSPYADPADHADNVCSCWLERELFAVRTSTDISEVLIWRNASNRSVKGGYNDQQRSQISQDGNYIYFDSNWLKTQDREIFRAELPPSWHEDLSGDIPRDDTPPTAPQNLNAMSVTESRIDITWQASTDPESAIATYKIYRSGTPIGQTLTTSYSDTNLNEATTYSYTVSAINFAGLESAKSNPVTATTFADTTQPSISSVSAAEVSVNLVFSEPVEEISAETKSNYAIDNGISITGATLNADLKTVTLGTNAHTEDVTYTITINNIRDRASTPNTVAPNSSATYTYTLELIVNNLNQITYQTAYLKEGDTYYIDRTFTITNIPSSCQNLLWIKTANDDKTSTGTFSLTFDVNQPVTVYIAYDQRISSLPTWLANWNDEGQLIQTSDTTLNLYSKNFPQGQIALGGNYGSSNDSMYAVLIKSSGQVGDTIPPAPPTGLEIIQ